MFVTKTVSQKQVKKELQMLRRRGNNFLALPPMQFFSAMNRLGLYQEGLDAAKMYKIVINALFEHKSDWDVAENWEAKPKGKMLLGVMPAHTWRRIKIRHGDPDDKTEFKVKTLKPLSRLLMKLSVKDKGAFKKAMLRILMAAYPGLNLAPADLVPVTNHAGHTSWMLLLHIKTLEKVMMEAFENFFSPFSRSNARLVSTSVEAICRATEATASPQRVAVNQKLKDLIQGGGAQSVQGGKQINQEK